MSLYNMLFEENKDADVLLKILGLTRPDFGRYRDIYLNKDGTEIVVYTRCGGGNREEYYYMFDKLSKHPCYVRDEDDDYDSTYCYLYFDVPKEHLKTTRALATGKDPENVSEKFNSMLNNIDKEKEQKLKDIAEKINSQIEEGKTNIEI